jgi:WD40-like Beta Propeller Repeat
MGRFLVLVSLLASGAAPAPVDAPVSSEPDGLLVMGVVGNERSRSAVHGERAMVADPRTGATRARRLPGGTLCYSTVMAVGDRVLYSGHRGRRAVALSLPLTLSGPPRSLGASGTITPSATPGRVWLGRWTPGRKRSRVALREHDVDSGRTVPWTSALLPGWARLEGAIAGGFVIGHGRRLTLWDHRLDRPLRSVRDGWPIAAGGSRVALCGPRCRTLRVWSLAGERELRPPPGVRLPAGAEGAFAPDGGRLAVPVTVDGGQRVAVVDLASGRWTVVPGGALREYGAIAWSPSGRWLYFTGRRLLGWRVGSPGAVRLPVDPGGTVMSIATTDG